MIILFGLILTFKELEDYYDQRKISGQPQAGEYYELFKTQYSQMTTSKNQQPKDKNIY